MYKYQSCHFHYNDLFYLKNRQIASCSVTLETTENPEGMDVSKLIQNLKTTYQGTALDKIKLTGDPAYIDCKIGKAKLAC